MENVEDGQKVRDSNVLDFQMFDLIEKHRTICADKLAEMMKITVRSAKLSIDDFEYEGYLKVSDKENVCNIQLTDKGKKYLRSLREIYSKPQKDL
jgi:Mn-dependent DtxR family transcriptional regulator